jgi:hypothetical protein
MTDCDCGDQVFSTLCKPHGTADGNRRPARLLWRAWPIALYEAPAVSPPAYLREKGTVDEKRMAAVRGVVLNKATAGLLRGGGNERTRRRTCDRACADVLR